MPKKTKQQSSALKKIGKAIWQWTMGKGLGIYEKAQKEHEATKRKKRGLERKAME
jgi:hypothetical protein